MAVIGEQLPTPDVGYQRINNSHEYINYTNSNLYYTSVSSAFESDMHYSWNIPNDSKVVFYFYGTKLRLICLNSNEQPTYSQNYVKIDDNVNEELYRVEKGARFLLAYEKINLEKKIHKVEILLTKGTTFALDALDIDDEGRLITEEEYLSSIVCCLIKQNDKYYSIKESSYDSVTKMYSKLENVTNESFDNYGFLLNDLIKETTIGSERFKPIDKFDKFTLVTTTEKTIKLKGLKSDKELIISNQNLSTVTASTIHNFILDVTKTSNGNIKFVISDDNGLTWKTWNGTIWNTLTNTCPLTSDNKVKQYSKLSDSEKNKWNQLKEEIWTSGIGTDTTDIDYNLLDENIRFAFVLYRPTCADNIAFKNISLLYDKIGNWHKLSESDIDIAININSCSVTAKLQNLENVKVNILI